MVNGCVALKSLREDTAFGMMSARPINSERIAHAFAGNSVLSMLKASSRARLVAGATVLEVDRGDLVCRQESPAERFWLLSSGEIKLVKYTADGAVLLIDIVLPRELVGAVFCPNNQGYPCAAVAMKRSVLVSLCLRDFLAEIEGNPFVQKVLLAEICSKLSHAQEMRALWLERARARIARVPLYLHKRFGRIIPQTRATLAEFAGTSVETAIRETNALARGGILSMRRGQMEILSLPGLRACAHESQPAL